MAINFEIIDYQQWKNHSECSRHRLEADNFCYQLIFMFECRQTW